MAVIDADAHVVETERTWDFIPPSDQNLRPVMITKPDGSGKDVRYWEIDGVIRGTVRQPVGKREEWDPTKVSADMAASQARSGRKMETPDASKHMEDVGARLRPASPGAPVHVRQGFLHQAAVLGIVNRAIEHPGRGVQHQVRRLAAKLLAHLRPRPVDLRAGIAAQPFRLLTRALDFPRAQRFGAAGGLVADSLGLGLRAGELGLKLRPLALHLPAQRFRLLQALADPLAAPSQHVRDRPEQQTPH